MLDEGAAGGSVFHEAAGWLESHRLTSSSSCPSVVSTPNAFEPTSALEPTTAHSVIGVGSRNHPKARASAPSPNHPPSPHHAHRFNARREKIHAYLEGLAAVD